MSFVYNGAHSIHFIEALDSSTNSTPTSYASKTNSWLDLNLIPLTRPSIVTPSPSIKLIEVPGTSHRIDLTDLQPGGLKFGLRSGSWKFAVDHNKYSDWHTAKKTVENALNGKRLYCVLDDDLTLAYRGRFSVSGWESGVTYSSVTISYQLEAKKYTNAFSIISTSTETRMIASWVEVDEAIRDGSYRTKYHVGDSIYLPLGGEYNGYAELVGIDLDVDSNNNPIPMTWITRNFLNTSMKMRGLGVTEGGWPVTIVRDYLNKLKFSFPSRVQTMIRPSKKTSRDYNNGSPRDIISNDEIWIPSYREIFGGTSYEQSGPIYNVFYNSNQRRRKTNINASFTEWWLRTVYDSTDFGGVYYNGTFMAPSADNTKGVALGFCTGESTTISSTIYTGPKLIGSWEEVDNAIQDGSYRTKYHVGDWIKLTIGNQYDGYADLVGIDIDVDSNNNPIPMTWITRNTLSPGKKMNNTNTYSGGWPSCTMRTYLNGLKSNFTSKVQSMIKQSKKISMSYNGSNFVEVVSYDYIWIPSVSEVCLFKREQTGIIYDHFFDDKGSRKKYTINGGGAEWWLRSLGNGGTVCYYFVRFTNNGNSYTIASRPDYDGHYAVLGFCTGAST